jgi:NAD-dependent deacetylase
MAGSRRVLELHGSIWRVRCVSCATRYNLGQQDENESMDACVTCGEHLRPDVVLFGELMPMDIFELAATKARECELCFVIGTSAVVYPAAALPEMASRAGAYTIEINPERTPLSELCDETIQGKAGEILPLLDAV